MKVKERERGWMMYTTFWRQYRIEWDGCGLFGIAFKWGDLLECKQYINRT